MNKKDNNLLLLFLINLIIFTLHIYENGRTLTYCFQLTVISQTLVIANFALSLILHERKANH